MKIKQYWKQRALRTLRLVQAQVVGEHPRLNVGRTSRWRIARLAHGNEVAHIAIYRLEDGNGLSVLQVSWHFPQKIVRLRAHCVCLAATVMYCSRLPVGCHYWHGNKEEQNKGRKSELLMDFIHRKE